MRKQTMNIVGRHRSEMYDIVDCELTHNLKVYSYDRRFIANDVFKIGFLAKKCMFRKQKYKWRVIIDKCYILSCVIWTDHKSSFKNERIPKTTQSSWVSVPTSGHGECPKAHLQMPVKPFDGTICLWMLLCTRVYLVNTEKFQQEGKLFVFESRSLVGRYLLRKAVSRNPLNNKGPRDSTRLNVSYRNSLRSARHWIN